MELTLTPEAEALIAQEMKLGHFQSPGDLIETALFAFRDTTSQNVQELNNSIQQGLDDIDSGNLLNEEESRAYLHALRARL